jgi:hypothetical protein
MLQALHEGPTLREHLHQRQEQVQEPAGVRVLKTVTGDVRRRRMGKTLGDKVWGTALLLAGVCLVVAGIATFGYQAFSWLKLGQWPPIDLQDLMAGPVRSKWLGLNEILFWFGRQSAALAAVLAGWGLIVAGNDTAGFK